MNFKVEEDNIRRRFVRIIILICLNLLPKIVSGNEVRTNERTVLRAPIFTHSYAPWWVIDPDNPLSLSGFLPRFYRDLQDFANVTVEYFPVGPEYLIDLQNHSKWLLNEGKIDMAPDLTFPLEKEYSYTMAIYTMHQRALVVQRMVESSASQIFEPFTVEYWLVLMGAILGGAIFRSLIILISYSKKGRISSTTLNWNRIVFDFHSTFTMFLGRDAGDDINMAKSPFLRLHKVGLLFLVLISTSTYTAELTALLTKKANVIDGPTNMEQLKASKVCTNWPDESMIAIYRRFVKEIIVPPNFTTIEAGSIWAIDQLLVNKTCDAIIGADFSINLMLKRNECIDLYRPPGIKFAPLPFYHKMITDTPEQKENFNRINNGITRYLADPKYNDLMNDILSDDYSCNKKFEDEDGLDFHRKIGIKEMLVPIIFYFGTSLLALVFTAVRMYQRRNNEIDDTDSIDPKTM